ncbi:ABC transporter permease [Mangrovicoccus sp. HB161399]|uniref:ABC transporter permease n=1 Tax=Mangrovicoccus sp. HB161399 TaxID=2720392 RepID=UPI0020A64970|nr:ABC transporter permease [Mangrovicoccus sp. HB161399]
MNLLNAFARMPRVVGALILREMATTYGKSPGGYLWAVLEPTLGIVVLSFGFQLLVRTPPVGDNFMLFYATGILPFMMYSNLQAKISGSISFSKSLLAYPSVTFIDAILARFLLNALMQVLVFYIVLGAIMLIYRPEMILDIPRIALALFMIMLLALGVGLLNCFLFSFYPLWKQLWAIATRPLMICSGVFFTYDSMPDVLKDWLWYNPILQIVGIMRSGVYYQYDASYVSLMYITLFATIPALAGLFFLNRYYRVILYEM